MSLLRMIHDLQLGKTQVRRVGVAASVLASEDLEGPGINLRARYFQ